MRVFQIKDIKYLVPTSKLIGECIADAIKGGPVEIRVMRESKSRIQEEKYHAMINDIAKTVQVEGKYYGSEIWKAQLVDEFEQTRKEIGEPLTRPGKMVMSLDKQRVVTIRASTKQFRKKEASDFIEFLYATGIDYGAKFTDKSLSFYESEIARET